jgi:hypothetical protein
MIIYFFDLDRLECHILIMLIIYAYISVCREKKIISTLIHYQHFLSSVKYFDLLDHPDNVGLFFLSTEQSERARLRDYTCRMYLSKDLFTYY